MKMPKFYTIEIKKANEYEPISYRFRSLYNGMVGTSNENIDDAILEGENHEKIVRFLHGKTNC